MNSGALVSPRLALLGMQLLSCLCSTLEDHHHYLGHRFEPQHDQTFHDDTSVLEIPGHLMLGALFPIHKQGRPCGEIQKEDGIQPLEALLFTVDQINKDKSLLPNITLGVKAVDSCDNPVYAAEKSLGLIKGFIARESNLTSTLSQFPEAWSKQERPGNENIVGLIGAQTSPVSVQIANLGRLFKIPQVSYLSTSVALCNRQEYPYFFRTVPSDIYQAQAIGDLLKRFNWKYASIVHSDSEYGTKGYQALVDYVSKTKEVCLADPITIYNAHFKDEDYKDAILQLLQRNSMSRVVIVFADRVPAGKLLEAAKTLRVKGRFIWIGSDAWASRESVVEKREEIVEGAIAVQPLRKDLPGYHEYFSQLIEKPNQRNPWFDEYLRHYHNCSNLKDVQGIESCSLVKNRISHPNQLYIHFVRDAVYAFAHALHNLYKDSCKDFLNGEKGRGLCPEFRQRVFRELPEYLKHVDFMDVDNHKFHFYGEHKHDGPPRYSIINFQRRPHSNFYDWHNVGTFHNGEFTEFDESFYETFKSDTSIMKCSRPKCEKSAIMVQKTEDLCCWHCIACNDRQKKVSDYECETCPLGEQSDGINRTDCVLIPETYLDYTNKWAIGAIIFASFGIVLTIVTAYVLWKYWDTPVVKACGRELSLMLLLGTFFSFTTTFSIVAKPSDWNCGLMRFCIGFSYTICYAAVVTKANRVSRIFNANRHPRFTSPFSSLVIAFGLVSVEIMVNIIWLLVEPPTTVHIMSDPHKRILVCRGLNDSFMTGLIYPFFLIMCATLYAFKTRKCPGGFNETRFIFFANTVTSIHWFAYVPLYLVSTDHEIRAVILAFSLSLSGIVQLGCLLCPKLYTVIFKPEKNTRVNVMKQQRSHLSYAVPDTPPNSVAMNTHPSQQMQLQHPSQYPNPSTQLQPQLPPSQYELLVTHSGSRVEPARLVHSASAIVTSNRASNATPESLHSCQFTWSSQNRPRTRSSSVCKGTQTYHPETSGRSVVFSVSMASSNTLNNMREEFHGSLATHDSDSSDLDRFVAEVDYNDQDCDEGSSKSDDDT